LGQLDYVYGFLIKLKNFIKHGFDNITVNTKSKLNYQKSYSRYMNVHKLNSSFNTGFELFSQRITKAFTLSQTLKTYNNSDHE
jgi:hypothetical protein